MQKVNRTMKGARLSARAISLWRNLERYDDWIVLTLTLATLAQFAQHNPKLRNEMIPILERRSWEGHGAARG
jgi:hypothetical protein